ncbi:MAG: hypothetical protein M0D55_12480 [Elusimicrobiota bacterium]|nr:MAG: hypothetical protein M0D55_12480 [Elusimicrobiota bacterium]
MRRPREDLILTRAPGGPWTLERQNGDLADGEAAAALLEGLRRLEFGPALEAGSVASGLGPADSVRVRALDASGRELFDGWFGRRVFARSAYFRARDGAPVRLASGLDPDLLTRPATDWREPRLMPGGCPGGLEASTGDRGGACRTRRPSSCAPCAPRVGPTRRSPGSTGSTSRCCGCARRTGAASSSATAAASSGSCGSSVGRRPCACPPPPSKPRPPI